MGALDDALRPAVAAGFAFPSPSMVQAVRAAPAAPANDAEAAAAPPPVPGVVGGAPVGGGALGQAVGIMNAARQSVAADPMSAMAAEALQKDQDAKDAAAQQVQANMEQQAKINAEPVAPRPPAPKLADTPAAPQPTEKNPLRVFGQLLPMLAALGALATHNPALNAMNAATAMINAAKTNDKEEEAKQRQAWIDNTKSVVQQNEDLLTQYKLALDEHTGDIADKQARIAAIAAQNKDVLGIAALKSGNLEALTNLMNVREKATSQLADLTVHLSQQDLENRRLDDERLYHQAMLANEAVKDGRLTPNEVLGPLLSKVAASGLESLTPAEHDGLATGMDILAGQRLGGAAGAKGGPLSSQLAAASQQPNTTTAPAAPQTTPTAPPAPKAAAGPPPEVVAKMKPGFRYTLGKNGVWQLINGVPTRVG